MSALTTRDALAKALHEFYCHYQGPQEFCSGPCELNADALIASGAVVDAATLADDEAAEAAFWRESEAGNTKRDRGGYYHAGFIDGFRALAAALTERGGEHG